MDQEIQPDQRVLELQCVLWLQVNQVGLDSQLSHQNLEDLVTLVFLLDQPVLVAPKVLQVLEVQWVLCCQFVLMAQEAQEDLLGSSHLREALPAEAVAAATRLCVS